ALRRGRAADLETPADVAAHRSPREQRELLEDHAPVGSGPHHLAAMDADLPCVARNETPEDVEQRALAASARADDRHELAVGDRQARHVEHLEGLAVSRIRLAE